MHRHPAMHPLHPYTHLNTSIETRGIRRRMLEIFPAGKPLLKLALAQKHRRAPASFSFLNWIFPSIHGEDRKK
jgi:hypothetical protein